VDKGAEYKKFCYFESPTVILSSNAVIISEAKNLMCALTLIESETKMAHTKRIRVFLKWIKFLRFFALLRMTGFYIISAIYPLLRSTPIFHFPLQYCFICGTMPNKATLRAGFISCVILMGNEFY